MIDISFVQAQYARLTDDALEHFAKNEASQLTAESFRLLQAEFVKRKLNTDILQPVEVDKAMIGPDGQTYAERIITRPLETLLWNYALSEKENGTSNTDIYNGLMRKGAPEQVAVTIVQSLAAKAKELIGNHDTSITLGWIFFFTGIILFILVSNRTLSVTFGMCGLLFLILAAIVGLKSYFNRKKYQAVIDNIEAEQNANNTIDEDEDASGFG